MPKGQSETHSFYCIRCGRAGLPLLRPKAKIRERFHRKKLYCCHCKCEVNHIECRDDVDVYEFKEAFANGDFEKELEESLKHCQGVD